MTNTQSLAPGVAAEAQLTKLLALITDFAIESGPWLTKEDASPADRKAYFDGFTKVTEALRTALQASAAAVPDPVEWEPLEEIPRERQMFDKQVELWGVQTTIATCLKIWGSMHSGGSYGAQCHIMANEVAKLYTAPPLPAQVQEAEPVKWTSGPNLFKDWCGQWFGPDSDDDYLARAVFDLPPMAQRFRTSAPGMAGGVGEIGWRDAEYKDSTPLLSVGNSAFEDWFQQQPFATQSGIKQISRDSYAAGMGDPLVTYATPHPSPVQQAAWARSIEGTIRFMRSEDAPTHVFCRTVDWDEWETNLPKHFGNGPNELLINVMGDDATDGKRVKVTIEVLASTATGRAGS